MKDNDNNLVSVNKFRKDIKSMKLLSLFFKPDMRKELQKMEQQVENMVQQTALFNKRFSDSGWCAYDSMSFPLIEATNKAYDEAGFEAAEKVLIEYYKTDVNKIVHWIKNSSEALRVRYDLIQKLFEDHFAQRYYASIPLSLIIIDGAVNDFTKSKGFFAEGTSVDAWDCLIGCSEGLTKLKGIFNQNRTKTNCEEIYLPYRNGILHGRDINYANERVACKCIALMFAVADWMKMKKSEETRREKFKKDANPPPLAESLSRLKKNEQACKEIDAWKRLDVKIGQDIPITGKAEDYKDFPYIVAIIEMLEAWADKNYGELSISLKKMFSDSLPDGKRAGECRKLFQNKAYHSFEMVEIEERACALSRVTIRAKWSTNDVVHEELLTFGCVYESKDGSVGLPWQNNGEWIIMPWDVQSLYE